MCLKRWCDLKFNMSCYCMHIINNNNEVKLLSSRLALYYRIRHIFIKLTITVLSTIKKLESIPKL